VSIWSAIGLALIATCCYQVGTVMQKVAADRMPRIRLRGGQGSTVRAFLGSPLWVGGLAVSAGGWVLFLKALANAPVSIVQPVLGFGLCLLALFSVVVLRERLRPLEWLGVGLMVAGIVLLGVSGAREHFAADAISRAGLVAASLAMLASLPVAFQIARVKPTISQPVVLGFASGVLIGLGALYAKALFVSLSVGAAVVGWTVFLPLVLLTNIGGMWVTQAGFQQGRALIVIAMSAVTNKIVTIVGGMAALGELLPDDAAFAVARLAGFAAVLIGTAILARFGAVSAAPPGEVVAETS